MKLLSKRVFKQPQFYVIASALFVFIAGFIFFAFRGVPKPQFNDKNLNSHTEQIAVVDNRHEQQAEEPGHRYLRTTKNFKSAGRLSLGTAITRSSTALDDPLAAKLSRAFPSTKVNAELLFTPAAAADGLLTRLASSDRIQINQLSLQLIADKLFLGDYRLSASTNSNLADLITVTLMFSCIVIDTDTGTASEAFSVDTHGAGLSSQEAEQNAKDRLVDSIAQHNWRFLSN